MLQTCTDTAKRRHLDGNIEFVETKTKRENKAKILNAGFVVRKSWAE
jgi:hypothetical protein